MTITIRATKGSPLTHTEMDDNFTDLNNLLGVILYGAGAPAAGTGDNGDFYLRTDGTVAGNTVIYHKEGGSWVALTTT